MKKRLVALSMFALAAQASAQSTGDLAFTSFNADEDGWSMVSFVDILAGTTVYFTDNEWSGTDFNTGESFHKWTTGAISAGTVIRFSAIDNATNLAVSNGTLARQSVPQSSGYGINAGEDTIYAYLGTSATSPSTFLAAISNGSFGTAGSGSLTNTGLAVGVGAMQLTASSDYAEYVGARANQVGFAAYKPLVNNVSNWNVQGDISAAALVPNTTAFTVTPVPEPGTYAMLLAGLAVLGAAARRRKAG